MPWFFKHRVFQLFVVGVLTFVIGWLVGWKVTAPDDLKERGLQPCPEVSLPQEPPAG